MTSRQWIEFALRVPRYHRTYRRYREFTMISASTYAKNLHLSTLVRDVPGCVVECGTWRGGMIAGIADVLGPEREYLLIDSFEGLPAATVKDGARALHWSPADPHWHNNCAATEGEARTAMSKCRAKRFQVIKGWFEQTLPGLVPPAPIALLRLDADWYESTMTCLTHLIPRLAERGIVIIDDYRAWDGCAKAIHDFLAAQNDRLPLVRLWQFGGDVHYLTRNP